MLIFNIQHIEQDIALSCQNDLKKLMMSIIIEDQQMNNQDTTLIPTFQIHTS